MARAKPAACTLWKKGKGRPQCQDTESGVENPLDKRKVTKDGLWVDRLGWWIRGEKGRVEKAVLCSEKEVFCLRVRMDGSKVCIERSREGTREREQLESTLFLRSLSFQ